MSHGDASHEPVDERTESGQQRDSKGGEGAAGTLSKYVRRGARSGAIAGVSGGATVLRGIRSIRAGDRARGLRRLVVGAGLLAVAAVQRRSGRDRGERIDIDQSDVVETSPDLESVVDESSAEPAHASGDEASSVVETGPDIEDAVEDESVESGTDAESGSTTEPETTDTTETEDAATETEESAAEAAPLADDRLGEAAFDEESNRVPAPQRAFNQEFLSMNAEVVWGIRDDDAVVVSQLFDPIEDGDDVRYVASTQVDENRLVTIPDEVLDHWETVSEGAGVVGGDDIVFATSDELAADEQLLVVPAAWAEEVIADA
ncbi:hypothetical protein [Halosimplex sp. J119]